MLALVAGMLGVRWSLGCVGDDFVLDGWVLGLNFTL